MNINGMNTEITDPIEKNRAQYDELVNKLTDLRNYCSSDVSSFFTPEDISYFQQTEQRYINAIKRLGNTIKQQTNIRERVNLDLQTMEENAKADEIEEFDKGSWAEKTGKMAMNYLARRTVGGTAKLPGYAAQGAGFIGRWATDDTSPLAKNLQQLGRDWNSGIDYGINTATGVNPEWFTDGDNGVRLSKSDTWTAENLKNTIKNAPGSAYSSITGIADLESTMGGASLIGKSLGVPSVMGSVNPYLRPAIEGIGFAALNIPEHSDLIEQRTGEFRPKSAVFSGLASGMLMSYAFALGKGGLNMTDAEAMQYAKECAKSGTLGLTRDAFETALKTMVYNAPMTGTIGGGIKEIAALPKDATQEDMINALQNTIDATGHELISGGIFGFKHGAEKNLQGRARYREIAEQGKALVDPKAKEALFKRKIMEKQKGLDAEIRNANNTFKEFLKPSIKVSDKDFDRGVAHYFLDSSGARKLLDKDEYAKLVEGPEANIDAFIHSLEVNVPKEFKSDLPTYEQALNAYKDSLIFERNINVINRYAQEKGLDQEETLGRYARKEIDVNSKGQIIDKKILVDKMKTRVENLKQRKIDLEKQKAEIDKKIQDKNTTLEEKQELATANEAVQEEIKTNSEDIRKPFTRAELIESVRDMVARRYGNNPNLLNTATERLAGFLASHDGSEPIGVDEAIGLLLQVDNELSRLNPDIKFDSYNSDIEDIINPKLIGVDNKPQSVKPSTPMLEAPQNNEPPLLEYKPKRMDMPSSVMNISEGSNQPTNTLDVGEKTNRESPSSFDIRNTKDIPPTPRSESPRNKMKIDSTDKIGSKAVRDSQSFDTRADMPQSVMTDRSESPAIKNERGRMGLDVEMKQKQSVTEKSSVVEKPSNEPSELASKILERIKDKFGKKKVAVKDIPTSELTDLLNNPNVDDKTKAKIEKILEKRQKKADFSKKVVTGNKTKMTTKANGGMTVDGQFGVVDVNDLQTATSIGETQNRNRETISSQAQINSIGNNPNPEYLIVNNPDSANGAMVITADGRVLSGNGRTLGLKMAYKSGNAEKYRAYLKEHAKEFGIVPENVDKIKNPVLVRIVDPKEGFDVKRFVKESNESQQLGRNAAEIARTDAENIKGILRFYEGTEKLNSAKNGDFIKKFFEKTVGDTERAMYLSTDGSLTPLGEMRIKNALLASLYGNNPRLIERLSNSTNEGVKKITNGLLRAVNDSAKLRSEIDKGEYWDINLGKDISDAALTYLDVIEEMNRQGVKPLDNKGNGTSPLNFYLKNMKDRLSPEGKQILGVFSELKSDASVANFLKEINAVIRGKGNPAQGTFFSEKGKKPSVAEILKESLQAFDSQFGTDFSKKDLSKWNMADKTLFDVDDPSVKENGIKFIPDYKSKKWTEFTEKDWADYNEEQNRIADEFLGKESTDTSTDDMDKTPVKRGGAYIKNYDVVYDTLPKINEKYDRESRGVPASVQAMMNLTRDGEWFADLEHEVLNGRPDEAINLIEYLKGRIPLVYEKKFANKLINNLNRFEHMVRDGSFKKGKINPISLEELEAQPIKRMPQSDVEAWREQKADYIRDKQLTEPSKFYKRIYASAAREVAELYKQGKITNEQRKLWHRTIKAEYDYNLDVDYKRLTKEQQETVHRALKNMTQDEANISELFDKGQISFDEYIQRRHELSNTYHDSLEKSGIRTNGVRHIMINSDRYKPQNIENEFNPSRTKDKATNPVSDKDLNNFLRGQAKQITKETGLNFKVVNSVDELRKMFPNNDITDTVEGGIHKDTVYLVKGNIDKDRLPLVIAHEVAGHRGVESLFENKQQMDNFFKSLEKASAKDKFIRDAFAEVDRLGYKENRSREAMAKIVEKVRNESGTLKGTAKTFVNFITSRVRRLLRRMGFKNLQLNEAEVYDIAIQALRRTGLKNSNKFFGLDRFLAKDNSFLSATSTELDQKYPGWQNQTNNSGGHTTQIKATVNTYRKIGEWIKNNMKGAKILDASSGLGEGTEALKQMGLNIEDVEPYASKKRKNAPIYDSYDKIKGKYDAIISNAVLNVIPDNWRSELLHNMADKLNDGGKLFINVRDAIEVSKQKQKVELDSPSEILVTNGKGGYRAYQKGFTQPELESWVKKELGSGYKVEKANEKNSGMPSGSRAVVITKEGGNGGKRTNPRYEEITKQLNSSQLKNRMSNDSAKPLTPLKTLQGTPIKRYGNLVGKRVGGKDSAGGQIYVHKNYANEIIPNEILNKVKKILAEKNPDFKYNAIMWDRDKGTIRFDEAPNFDTAPEPIPGKILTINPSTGEIKEAYSDRIWHHKWMWVKDDYKGFDTKESWERSREWLNGLANLGLDKNHSDYSLSHNGIANGSASGYDAWNKQLKYYGLDHLIDDKNNFVPKADIQFSIGARKSPIENVASKASDEMNTYPRKRNAKEAKKVLDKNFDYYEKLKKGTFKNKKLTDYKASALKASYLTGYDTKEKETMARFKAIGDFNKTREAVREYIDKTIPSDKRAKLLDSLMKQKTTDGIMDIAGKASIEKERAIRNSELEILRNHLKDLKANKISTEHSMLKLDALSNALTQEELDGLLNTNDFSTGAVRKMYKLLRTARKSIEMMESDEAGNLKVPDKIKALASELDSQFNESLNPESNAPVPPSMKVSVETLAKLNHILKDIKDQSRIAKVNLAKDATNEAYMAKEKIVGEMKPVNEAVANSRETNRAGLYNTHFKPISAMNTLDLDNFTSEMGETMNKVAYKDMLAGQRRKEHYLARGYKQVDDIIESFGKDKEDGLENLNKTFTTVETSDKHKYDITRDEAMAIYAMSTDRETRKIIKANGGLTLYLGDKKGSDSFTLSTDKLNEIAKSLTAKEKEAVMRVKKSLAQDYLPELNAVHERLNGVPLRLLVDETYFPRTYMEDSTTSKGNGVLDGLSAPYVSDAANADWVSIIKHRNDGGKFRLKGLTKTYENYVDQASNYIGMAEPLKKFNRILDKGMEKEITQRYGWEYFDRLQRMTQLNAGMAGKTKEDQQVLSRYLSNIAAAKLTPVSALKQFSSVPLASSVIPYKYLAQAMFSGVSKENISEMMELDPMVLRYRDNALGGIMPLNATNMETERNIGTFKGKGLWNKIVKGGLNLSLEADKRALGIIYKATKLMAEAQGKGGDKAYIENRFMEAVRRTQNTTDLASATGWQEMSRKSSHWAFLNMYLNQTQKLPNEYIRLKRMITQAEKAHGKDSAQYKEAKGNLVNFMIGMGLMNAVSIGLGAGASALLHKKDEKKTGKETAAEIVTDSLFNFVGNPILKPALGGSGYVLQKALPKSLGGKRQRTTNEAFGNDFANLLPDATYTMSKMMEDLESDEPAMRKLKKVTADALGSKSVESALAMGRVPTWYARYIYQLNNRWFSDDSKSAKPKDSESRSLYKKRPQRTRRIRL